MILPNAFGTSLNPDIMFNKNGGLKDDKDDN